MSELEEQNLVGSTVRYDGREAEVAAITGDQKYILEFSADDTTQVPMWELKKELGIKTQIDITKEKLHEVMSESSDRDRIFSPYGEVVTILEAPSHALDEIMLDCDPEQLLKLINVVEDQLNDVADSRKTQRDYVERLLYVRYSAIRVFRKKIGVPEQEQWSQYSPIDDYVIESYIDEGGDLDL